MLRKKERAVQKGEAEMGENAGNAARERYAQRCRLWKEVSPPLERKSHNGISDGKNVFFSDERKIEGAQPNVNDDKWRSASAYSDVDV